MCQSFHLLKVLQMSDTALKTRSEKLTLTFMCFMLGSWRRRSLCCGVKSSLASAWMPYLSNVQWVFNSHVFFFSHHRAWSDQSFFTSTQGKKRVERMRFGNAKSQIERQKITKQYFTCILLDKYISNSISFHYRVFHYVLVYLIIFTCIYCIYLVTDNIQLIIAFLTCIWSCNILLFSLALLLLFLHLVLLFLCLIYIHLTLLEEPGTTVHCSYCAYDNALPY